tara:strand:- start:129 stop:548 length:420 start_codon:yes stop_codon:yes gene_type:complete
MTSYNITFRRPDGSEDSFQCEDDQFILDAAEESGIEQETTVRVQTTVKKKHGDINNLYYEPEEAIFHVHNPSYCRTGSCSTCACKLISGTLEHVDQKFLTDKNLEDGFILSCVATPTSDCILETGKEEELIIAHEPTND